MFFYLSIFNKFKKYKLISEKKKLQTILNENLYDCDGSLIFPPSAEKVEIERESGVDGVDEKVDYSGFNMDYGSDCNPCSHSGNSSLVGNFPSLCLFLGKE